MIFNFYYIFQNIYYKLSIGTMDNKTLNKNKK